MANPVEHIRGEMSSVYRVRCPKNRTEEGEPLRAEVPPALDYGDMTDYIRSWPDKLVSFVAGRLCDDDMDAFARELYEYLCAAGPDGPAFEEWRRT